MKHNKLNYAYLMYIVYEIATAVMLLCMTSLV